MSFDVDAEENITALPFDDDAPHLLVIDDDKRIRLLLSRFLQDHGYRVSTAENAQIARHIMSGLRFDLLVLDVMMPGLSGTEFAREIRQNSHIPILMLTARSETEHRILGFEVGVDDYLAKPFEPRELLLRIHAILRRSVQHSGVAHPLFVRFGSFVFSIDREELQQNGEVVRLTDREKYLLKTLAMTPNQPVSRFDLSADDAGARALDVLVTRLRRKIEEDPAEPRYLQTVRSVGFRLVAEVMS